MIYLKHGTSWIILNWKLKVLSRPKSDSHLLIKTWISSENALFFYRDFEVLDENSKIVAIATSKWVLFDINKKSIIKIPVKVKETYPCIEKTVFEEKFNQKLNEPDNSKFVMDYKVQRRDIDTNHHVNNLYYLDYAYEALPKEVYNTCNFSNIEIIYKHEAKLGDTLFLFLSQCENGKYIVTIKDKDYTKIHAVVILDK